MAANVKFKKGAQADLPAASDGQILFATDTGNLYIDDNSTHIRVNAGHADTADSATAATTAEALESTNIGSANTPVFINSEGKPVAINFSIEKSVPSDAVFTDTNTKVTQSRTTTSSFRPVLQHYTYADYNADPGTATNQVYYNENVGIQPSTGTLKATKLHSTDNTTVGGMLIVGGKVELWSDTAEGGNIRLTSPNGSLWSIDALENTKLRFIWDEATVPFSFSNDGTISGAYFTGTANYANSAGTAADMPVTTITKSLTVTTSWQNTGIVSSNLPTGTYAVQISGISNGNCGLWGDIFSGVMSWHDGGTNGGDADEIMLHSAGHARNGGHLFLRIQRTANTDGKTYLQIRAASNASAAQNVVFKFRRLI